MTISSALAGVVFDAYGTLFDVYGVQTELGARFPSKHATKENLSSTRQTRQEIQKTATRASTRGSYSSYPSIHEYMNKVADMEPVV